MKLFMRLPIIIAILMLPTGIANAQMDFLKRGKDLLRELPGGQSTQQLSDADIGAGLREAFKISAERVVGKVGTTDGFNGDPTIHIPLPESLQKVQSTLSRIGMSSMTDDLELRLNRAAEAASPEAQAVFWQAIDEMTWDDVREIFDGPDDAATRYLERTMSSPLVTRMKPIVDASLAEVGAVRTIRPSDVTKRCPLCPTSKPT